MTESDQDHLPSPWMIVVFMIATIFWTLHCEIHIERLEDRVEKLESILKTK